MRVARKEIKDTSVIIDLLNSSPVGRLGTVGPDGYPMIKPLNFVCLRNVIYFHSAPAGEKIDHITRDARVCFEVDLPVGYARSEGNPCNTDYLYRSVIVRGRASMVEAEEEKISALKMLLDKYEPERGAAEFPESKVAITAVVRIDIETMTGKEDLGSGEVREKVLEALSARPSLPVFRKK